MVSTGRIASIGAVVLAGGGGRRLGGVDKPALRIAGTALLDAVLTALAPVADRGRTVVVGPDRELPPPLLTTREHPPGSGPAAAVAAGLDRLAADPPDVVFLLAADLPAITTETLARLGAATVPDAGAVLVDPAGREQYLLSAWPYAPVRAAAGSRSEWSGAALHHLLGALPRHRVPALANEAADIDTPDDLRRWTGEIPG